MSKTQRSLGERFAVAAAFVGKCSGASAVAGGLGTLVATGGVAAPVAIPMIALGLGSILSAQAIEQIANEPDQPQSLSQPAPAHSSEFEPKKFYTLMVQQVAQMPDLNQAAATLKQLDKPIEDPRSVIDTAIASYMQRSGGFSVAEISDVLQHSPRYHLKHSQSPKDATRYLQSVLLVGNYVACSSINEQQSSSSKSQHER